MDFSEEEVRVWRRPAGKGTIGTACRSQAQSSAVGKVQPQETAHQQSVRRQTKAAPRSMSLSLV